MTWVWILVIAAIIAVVIWRSRTSWTTVFVGTGNQMEEAEYKYNLLKEQGIRCKLKSTDPQGAAVGMAGPIDTVHSQGQYKIVVHQDDVEKAKELLQRHSSAIV
ncbi:putative signal transducing protein [Paenibacillus sp. J2TS4]|uniref:putative signal transducing protein n=1 Tax=Paenibacillus sp. J2TS4 TaxID=2807194 RepID=UPI001B0F9AD2|nr:DUF2007 domain-containing protein [Paenibacillus sp. J2TS4]GIP34117.1 hypothetical protein J2TS4_33270 [Paenibacillus sp. J2TS4]